MDFKLKSKDTSKLKTKVGLDIGTSAVKLVEISPSQEKPQLLRYGLKKTNQAVREEALAALRALVEESGIRGREVNVSLSGPSVIVRLISMPRMKEEELKSAVKFEAEKFIPFDIDKCVVDFQILGKEDPSGKSNILLVVAKKDEILGRIKLVEDAGLSVGIVDVDSLAVVNAFLRNYPNLEITKSVALINIGASFTGLSIIREGSIFFSRDLPVGGNAFNEAASKKIEEERSVFSALLDEIKPSFSYYENQCGKNVDELYLSGGGSSLAGLGEALEEGLGSKPIPWDPLQFLDAGSLDAGELAGAKSSLAVSVGLALR